MEHIRFLSTAVKDRQVGAFWRTSAPSVRQICRPVEKDRPLVVVEYGPGTGVFTRYLLKHLHPGSTVIGIELNRLFARRLRRFSRKRRVKQPQLVVANTDCGNVLSVLQRCGFRQADYIISGIPFSLIDAQTKATIIARTSEALAPEGRFVIYQYSFRVRELLKEQFEVVRACRSYFNFPPLCVLEARKIQDANQLTIDRKQVVGKCLEPAVFVDARQR
jgi:phospholipid N-methyltransferase